MIHLFLLQGSRFPEPASSVMRHADAGYEIAKQCAREHGLNLPMLKD